MIPDPDTIPYDFESPAAVEPCCVELAKELEHLRTCPTCQTIRSPFYRHGLGLDDEGCIWLRLPPDRPRQTPVGEAAEALWGVPIPMIDQGRLLLLWPSGGQHA